MLALLPFSVAIAASPPTVDDCNKLPGQHETNECPAQAYGASWIDNAPPECFAQATVWPCDGEEDHWAATRLELQPGEVINNVRYSLFHGENNSGLTCDATLAHRAALYIGTQTEPDADPVVIDEWMIGPYNGANNGVVTFERALTSPYEMQPGEFAFIAVQYAGDVQNPLGPRCASGGPVICQSTCPSNGMSEGFWGNASSPTFNWANLMDYGINGVPQVGARTYVVP